MSFPPYPSYQDSGVEWLGAVPRHWRVERLGNLYREVSEAGSPELPVLSVSIHTGVSDEEAAPEDTERKIVRSEDRSKYKRVSPNDLTYNMMRAWQGGFGTVQVEGMVSPAYVVARPRTEVPSKYIELLLRTPGAVEEMRRRSRGVTDFRLRLYWDQFKDLRVALPPKEERDAILAFVNRETAKIDALVEEQRRLIELLKEKRQAVISQAVTKGLDPTVPIKASGVEWLGDVPEHWEVIPMKRLASIRYGIGEPPTYQRSGTPLIRATNVDAGKILAEGMVFVDPDDIPVKRVVWLQEGDIIVVRSGAHTGDSAIITPGHCPAIAGFDMVLRPLRCEPMYLQYALLAAYLEQGQIAVERMRAAQPHLNAEELGSCMVAVPPEPEQQRVVQFLGSVTAEIDLLSRESQKTISLLAERRAALISSAVTGEIDVRSAAPQRAEAA